jgi:hypothetical protein
MTERWRWLTPPAPAAIAMLRMPAVAAAFDRAPPPAGRARLLVLRDAAGAAVDEAVVAGLDDGLEVMVHGGPGVRAALAAALASHGLVEAPGPADARWDALAAAAHPAAVRWLLAHPPPAVPPFPPALLARCPVVLICGPANAGKSSLLNAWCGRRRALVSDLPGTTRDLVAAETLVHGWRLRLLDSAGLRDAADPLERAGQELVALARRWADAVVYLRPPGDDGGAALAGDLVVPGKADLLGQAPERCWSVHGVPGRPPGDLLEALGLAVLRRLGLLRA